MILNQVRAYDNNEARLFLAKKFIEGSAKNSLKILKYYSRRNYDLSNEINNIEILLSSLNKTTNINDSMQVEGKIKETYFNAFNTIIKKEDFKFTKRTRRPPKDYLNALISFINSLIYTYVLSEIYQTHLDPRIGFLHSTNFRRFSLNLDVAEIFKVVIGDRLLLSLINRNEVKTSDYEKILNGIVLNDKGKRKVLEKMEEKLQQTVKYKTLKKEVSYRRLMRLELYKLEKHLMGEEIYKPFVMEW